MSTATMMAINVATIFGAYFLYTSGTIDRVHEWHSSTSIADLWSSVVPYSCKNELHPMQPRFLSYDPIIVHVEGFLTSYEARHLGALAKPRYKSTGVDDLPAAGKGSHTAEVGALNSEIAWLGSPDPVVDCVRARAAEFQGFASNSTMDLLAAVKYSVGGEFPMHYDYSADTPQAVDRKTSFLAILETSRDLQGGATYFPLVERPAWNSLLPHTWCRFIECAAEGLLVKPIVGNALFWVNFREDGTGHEATAHSEEPVTKGSKVGLNIWTYDRVLE